MKYCIYCGDKLEDDAAINEPVSGNMVHFSVNSGCFHKRHSLRAF